MGRVLGAASAAIFLLSCSGYGGKVDVPTSTAIEEVSSPFGTETAELLPVDVEGTLSHRLRMQASTFSDPKVEPEVPLPKLRGMKTMVLGFLVFICMLILIKAYQDASQFSRLGKWSERASTFLFDLDVTLNPHVTIVEDVSTEQWIEAGSIVVFASGASTFVNSLFQRRMARRGVRSEGLPRLRGLGAIFSVFAILFAIWVLEDYVPYIAFLMNVCTGMLITGLLLLGTSLFQALKPFSALMKLLQSAVAKHLSKNVSVESSQETQKASDEQPETLDDGEEAIKDEDLT